VEVAASPTKAGWGRFSTSQPGLQRPQGVPGRPVIEAAGLETKAAGQACLEI
jgi:hypothetical protein